MKLDHYGLYFCHKFETDNYGKVGLSFKGLVS